MELSRTTAMASSSIEEERTNLTPWDYYIKTFEFSKEEDKLGLSCAKLRTSFAEIGLAIFQLAG